MSVAISPDPSTVLSGAVMILIQRIRTMSGVAGRDRLVVLPGRHAQAKHAQQDQGDHRL
jgi:hypothetical protein